MCMEAASGAKLRTASSPPKATRGTARRTVEAGVASTWAVPKQLLEAARPIARLTEEAGAASTRAAPSTSPKLPAVCTARYVSSASSPTMRRTMHRNSPARRRRPKPRVSWRSCCEDSTGGGGAAHRLVTAVMCTCARLFVKALRIQFNREPVACEEASATSAPPHRRGAPSSPRVYTVVMCTVTPLQDASCPSLGAGQPAGSHRSSTERGALGAHGQLV